MWPFKKKENKPKVNEPETVKISADDDGMRRAEIAMRHAGFAINGVLFNQLPWVAQVFDEYKKLDYAAGVKFRKTMKEDNNDSQ